VAIGTLDIANLAMNVGLRGEAEAQGGEQVRAGINRTLASAAHQAQHHLKQVDEVEVERSAAIPGLAPAEGAYRRGRTSPCPRVS